MIGRLCDLLNCDGGDGFGHIRAWAGHKLDKVQEWLERRKKHFLRCDDEQVSTRLKFGQWQNACLFVWLSILAFEKRTYQTTIWSLTVICKQGAELQDGDEYIPNYALQQKRKNNDTKPVRKTRPLNLAAVHRYAEELKRDWPEFDRWCGDLEIPALKSIDCTRGEDTKTSVDAFIECQGKKSTSISLPGDEPWDVDIKEVNGVIKISPDPGGVGFLHGLKDGDILRQVNGVTVGKTVDDAYGLIVAEKGSKKVRSPDGRYKAAIVNLIILRL
jgi:hypothetical protein